MLRRKCRNPTVPALPTFKSLLETHDKHFENVGIIPPVLKHPTLPMTSVFLERISRRCVLMSFSHVVCVISYLYGSIVWVHPRWGSSCHLLLMLCLPASRRRYSVVFGTLPTSAHLLNLLGATYEAQLWKMDDWTLNSYALPWLTSSFRGPT